LQIEESFDEFLRRNLRLGDKIVIERDTKLIEGLNKLGSRRLLTLFGDLGKNVHEIKVQNKEANYIE
jgi:hypothetical protein